MFFALGAVVVLIGSIKQAKFHEFVSSVDNATAVVSAVLMLAGSLIMLYASYPKRILLTSFYDGGRSRARPNSFWKHHFGTPMLLGSQLQLCGVFVWVVGGAAQVLVIDTRALVRQGFWSMLQYAADDAGWMNIGAGLAGTLGMAYLNRSVYPENVTRPQSDIGRLLNTDCVQTWIGRRLAQRLNIHVGNDNLWIGWLLTVGTGLYLLAVIVEDGARIGRLLEPALEFIAALFMLQFGYQQDSVLDPVIFGCYRSHPRPERHPMGPLFNTDVRDALASVDRAVADALGVLDLPWETDDGVLCWWEAEHFAAMKISFDVDMHVFGLATMFKSIDMKEEDPSVQHVEFLHQTAEADVMYLQSHGDEPMPPSDEVFMSVMHTHEQGLVVAEWSVRSADRPQGARVMRRDPFNVFVFTPRGPTRTCVTACIVTDVASWMPHILVRDELNNVARRLQELVGFPRSPEGRILLRRIHAEIWKAAAREMKPCFWSFVLSTMPGLAELEGVAAGQCDQLPHHPLFLPPPPEDPLHAMPANPSPDPMQDVALGLAFAYSADWVEELSSWTQSLAGWFTGTSSGIVRRWSHPHKGTYRASVMVEDVHPMLLALVLRSEEFKRKSNTNIKELRKVRELSGSCSIWYQRASYTWLAKDRQSIYASVVADFAPDHVVICEWTVQDEELVGLDRAVQAKCFFLWELKGAGGDTRATVTAAVDPGGVIGCRWLSPLLNRTAGASLTDGMAELAAFFKSAEGADLAVQVQEAVAFEVATALASELTDLQRGFMEAHCEGFQMALDRSPGRREQTEQTCH